MIKTMGCFESRIETIHVHYDSPCLITSARNNDTNNIKKLLQKGYCINTVTDGIWINGDKNSALIVASDVGNISVVSLLIKKGCNVNKQNSHKETALIRVCSNYTFDVDYWIAEKKEKISQYLIKRKNKFRYAIARLLINSNRCDMNLQNEKGHTALMITCKYNYENVAKLLINAGCDIEIADKDNNTAFLYAYTYGSRSIMEALIKAGCSINTKNIIGKTIMDIICDNNDRKLVIQLINSGCEFDGSKVLTWACNKGYGSIIRILVTNGIDRLVLKDLRGDEIMVNACRKGWIKRAQLLIDNNCNLDYSKFMYNACINNRKNIVKLIIKSDHCPIPPINLLHWACSHKYYQIARMLIKRFCPLNVTNDSKNMLKYIDYVDSNKIVDVNNWILSVGLIGTCVRYIKQNINKFYVKDFSTLNKDIKRFFINYKVKSKSRFDFTLHFIKN